MVRRLATVALIAGLCCGAAGAEVYAFELPTEESDAAWDRAQIWLAAQGPVFRPLRPITEYVIQSEPAPPGDLHLGVYVSRRPRGDAMFYKVAVLGLGSKKLTEMLAAYIQREVEACLSGTVKECREAFPDAVIQKFKR